MTVAGQGVWSISGANVVFTPAPGFLVDPDPISYRITDSTGDPTSAQITLDYVPRRPPTTPTSATRSATPST